MRVLLTGSSGWLGRSLAPRLRKLGHDVLGLDIVTGRETAIVGSIADRGVVDGVFGRYRPDAVVHAAALHKPDIVRHTEQAFIDVNVTGTLNLLTAARIAGVGRFVFTSTTSLMISHEIHASTGDRAEWIDETLAPLEPRNIYGVTKLSAEQLCRHANLVHGLPVIVLRTGRFFPEEDDMAHAIDHSGPNAKANEFLNRRLTVEDAVEAHVVALMKVPEIGFDTFIVSAVTPFSREDCGELKRDAAAMIRRIYPDAAELYARQGWTLPRSIGRVYDASRMEQVLGFRAKTDFAAVLAAIREGRPMRFAHDPSYVSPYEAERQTTQIGQRP
jgi:UDP-glucose 4-epimerase